MSSAQTSAPSAARGKGFLIALICPALLVIGCSTNEIPSSGSPTEPPPATPFPPPEFPLTVTDDDGTLVTIPVEPQTIVSLTPANTEIVYALGAGERMRGGTDF